MNNKYIAAALILILAGAGVFYFPVVAAIFMVLLALFIFILKSIMVGYWKAFVDLLKRLLCDW